MTHDVFISYSSLDKDAALAICHTLEQNNLRCWIAPRDIPPGSEYGDLIDEAIKSCRVVVVVFSEYAAASPWVNGELNVAFTEQKIIIPFRLDGTPLKGQTRVMLNQRHWIDAYPDYRTKFNDLVQAVALSVGRDINNVSVRNKISINKHRSRKYVVWGLIVCVLLPMLIIIAFIYKNHINVYSYNKNGIKVSVKGISSNMKTALNSIFDNMVLVEGNTFVMGNNYLKKDYLTSLDSLSSPPHMVTISNYYISKFEVTRLEWNTFCRDNLKRPIVSKKQAVDNISWEEAVMFVDSLRIITGLDISLPTEAQWEYAAMGGLNHRGKIFAGFSENESAHDYAWLKSSKLAGPADVGLKLPNELGLYDMIGNVSEWCFDSYIEYSQESLLNPKGAAHDKRKIYRGGDYTMPNLLDMKITSRYYGYMSSQYPAVGMRLVINIK